MALGWVDSNERGGLLMKRARRKTASKDLKKAAERVKRARVAKLGAARESARLRREHREALRQVHKASRKKYKAARKWRLEQRRLGLMPFPDDPIPLIPRSVRWED